MGFEIVTIENCVEDKIFASVDDYLDWLSASWHGKLDVWRAYNNNSESINITNPDGSVTYNPIRNYVIVKKK